MIIMFEQFCKVADTKSIHTIFAIRLKNKILNNSICSKYFNHLILINQKKIFKNNQINHF